MHDPGLFDSMKVSQWAGGGGLRSQQLGRSEREGWVDSGHESEAVKEVRLSGAKHLRVGLETVYKLCLQCHESPGHYNDEPSWGHIQHSPLSPSPVEIWASPWL